MTTRSVEQGLTPHCAPSRAGAERDLSILPANPSFPRLYLMQAATDVLDAVRCSFFATAAAAFVIATIFVLLFVGI